MRSRAKTKKTSLIRKMRTFSFLRATEARTRRGRNRKQISPTKRFLFLCSNKDHLLRVKLQENSKSLTTVKKWAKLGGKSTNRYWSGRLHLNNWPVCKIFFPVRLSIIPKEAYFQNHSEQIFLDKWAGRTRGLRILVRQVKVIYQKMGRRAKTGGGRKEKSRKWLIAKNLESTLEVLNREAAGLMRIRLWSKWNGWM